MGAVLAVAASVAIATAPTTGLAAIWETWEGEQLNGRHQRRGPRPLSGDVVVVALDDETLQRFPDTIQRRAGLALLIEALRAAAPTVIGIDAWFDQPEAPLPGPVVGSVEAAVAHPEFAALPVWASAPLRDVFAETLGDARLAEALRTHGPVVLGLHESATGQLATPAVLQKVCYGQVAAAADEVALPESPALLLSLPAFNDAAVALGLFTVEQDRDRVVRRLPVTRLHQGTFLAPFSVQLAARHLGLAPAAVGLLPGESLHLGERVLAVPDNVLLLNHRGKGAIARVSAADVLAGRVGRETLGGKVVIVGFTWQGHDTVATPDDPFAAGVEIHATAVDNLLRGDLLRRASPWLEGTLVLLLGLGVVAAFSLLRARRAVLVVPVLIVAVAVPALVGELLYARDVWFSVVGPMGAVALVGAATLVTGWLTTGREKRALRRAFAHYLDPRIIAELLDDPRGLALGGARRDVTVLFSDVRGFTTLSETMTPEALIRFLNTYLEPMAEAVLAERGFIDKYIGDAVMAVFGAPVTTTDHAARALDTVLRMHTALPGLRATLGVDLAIGVGLHSGEAVAGNMGSAQRFNYTVVGDTVNLASRLEGLTKKYGVFCIVSDETRRQAGRDFAFRELDRVRVKGRSAPLIIHEFLGRAGDGAAHVVEHVDVQLFADGLSALVRGDFTAARADLQLFADKNPHDVVARLHLARLDALGSTAPTGWDRVFAHDEK